MQKEKFKLIATAHLFLIRDGKILLARRFNTGYEDGNYSLPAGHHDGSESITYAMARETLEEIGIRINPSDLKMAHVMHKKQADERIDFFFTTDKWLGEPVNAEPHKCDDLNWFPLDSLPKNTIPYVRTALANYLKGTYFSEFGWN